jgi:integrase
MAFFQCRQGSYRVLFRYHGKQQAFTLGQVSKDEAETKAAQVDYLLMRLKQRLAEVPPGMDIVEYVQFDGKQLAPSPAKLTLGQLRDRYTQTHAASLEANSLATIKIHFGHFAFHLGDAFPIPELSLSDLQRYVDQRAKADGINGRKLSAVTIRKEIVTLRGAWNWATKMKLVAGVYPSDGLRFPKTSEKPPFQTLAEIERQIKAGATAAETAELYDCLYLQIHETAELLTYVKENGAHGFLHPMFCLAAHTGARRSEIIRLKVSDVDLISNTVTIHERKRVKGKATTRRVPMSPFLIDVLKQWLADHPGGPWLFCHESTVTRSRKRSATTGHMNQKTRPKSGKERLARLKERDLPLPVPLTRDEVHDHLKRTLAGSKWEVLRGYHALRHSFISACACRGVDQRYIDEWVGHQTDEQRRRYRHLTPNSQQAAIATVFQNVA